MELANEILEDEPNAPKPPERFNVQYRNGTRYRSDATHGSGASSLSLSKLSVITSGLSGY